MKGAPKPGLRRHAGNEGRRTRRHITEAIPPHQIPWLLDIARKRLESAFITETQRRQLRALIARLESATPTPEGGR
jgi:hypothetical protein